MQAQTKGAAVRGEKEDELRVRAETTDQTPKLEREGKIEDGELPNPGTQPVSPARAGRFFTAEPPGKPCKLAIRQ